MNLRRAYWLAAFALPLAASPAAAQFQAAPGGRQPPPCIQKFMALRDDASKKAAAIEAAGKRKQKPSVQVACKLFTNFVTAEGKLLKYVADNSVWCGIPQQVMQQIKTSHAKSTATRARICKIAAAGPPQPRGPSLSDALGTAVPDASNIRSGHGTFDTLTGSPIGSQ
jgi:hypothetical protein